MTDLASLCTALVELLREENGDDLLGALATGSRVHGTPGPTSDLDVQVVIGSMRRQRRNIILHGVEIEMFFNPPARVRGYFADRHLGSLHMFAFGHPIHDPSGVVAELRHEARAIWQAGPPPLPASEHWHPRYVLADMVRDLTDLAGDPPAAALQIARIVDTALLAHSQLAGKWPEKPKRRLAALAQQHPALASLAVRALSDGPLDERRVAAAAFAAQVLAPIGGLMPLEWHSDWEALG